MMSETILNMKVRELHIGANAQNFQASADQETMELQSRLSTELATEEAKHNREIHRNIKEYLEAYNADKQFTYVLPMSVGNPLGDST